MRYENEEVMRRDEIGMAYPLWARLLQHESFKPASCSVCCASPRISDGVGV